MKVEEKIITIKVERKKKRSASLSRNRHNKQWPVKSSIHLRCGLCSSGGQRNSQCLSAPDVTWACVWCLVLWNIAQK